MTPHRGIPRLRDRRAVSLHEAGAADVPAITRLYRELSPRSYAMRFLVEPADDDSAERFAALPSEAGSVSLLARLETAPDRLAGEARYLPIEDGLAELAITVRDDLAGLGLGTILLASLRDRATEAGIERLLAVVCVVNRPMLRLLGTVGWAATHPIDAGSAFLEISAVPGMPGWPDTGARRVLVEGRGWLDNDTIARLRDDDTELRRCPGPEPAAGRRCPLVTSGRCRLAEGADLIVPLLPTADPPCRDVVEQHRHRWPERLAPDPAAG